MPDTTKYITKNSLNHKEYYISKQLSRTLQGMICEAFMLKEASNLKVIIKTAFKTLHNNRITIQDKKYFGTNENILKERDILQLITATNNTLTASIVKYIDFGETLNAYYIIQEHGGINLLHYITKQHGLMRYGNNDQRKAFLRKSWKKLAFKYIFSMISTLNWLHDTVNIVHLDVSLNNYTFDKKTDTIKLIDFGLAEIIWNNNFRINKYVGKQIYKCPEIIYDVFWYSTLGKSSYDR